MPPYIIALLAIFCTCGLATISNNNEKYRILALIPYNGKSHFYFAAPLFEELARRGHDITVVSHHPRHEPLANYHDISLAPDTHGKEIGIHSEDMEIASRRHHLITMLDFFQRGIDKVCGEALSHPSVQKLIKSQNERFDLLIVEAFNSDCFLGFQHKFKVPVVTVRTSALSTWIVDRTGNPDNPSYVPVTVAGLPSRMNFLERAQNLVYNIAYKILYRHFTILGTGIARKHFGEDMPDLDDLAKNRSLYLVDTHFIQQSARPLVPSVKEVAGLHLRKAKPLPEDLENWILGAGHHGVVYFNLGSMLNPSSMSADKRRIFLRAFAKLPQRVLMKWNSETMEDLPSNIRLTTWAPQNDILHHPNVKLFITHGGMLGIIESLDAGVPMLVIPFFGDQPTNAALIQERGLGAVLKYPDITLDVLEETLDMLLNDSRFAQQVRELSAAFRDRPLRPLDEAVYWVEYVARHKGAPFLRTPALDLPLHQYLLLDVIGAFAVAIFVVFYALKVVGKLFRSLLKPAITKVKSN